MKILIIEHLIRQTKSKNKISRETVRRIYKEFDTLSIQNQEGQDNLRNYLNKQNGKQLKGSEHIFKYRLDDGDRILYTYGKYLDYLRSGDEDSMVLLAYSKHDDQDKYRSLPQKQNYKDVRDIIAYRDELALGEKDFEDFDIDDIEGFAALVLESYQKQYAMYVYDSEMDSTDDQNEKWDFLLSSEQATILDDFIRDTKPTLIMGGAGTGKTVLAIHLLNEISGSKNPKSAAYFTQSKELLRSVEKKYERLAGENLTENPPGFYDINEFCIDFLQKDGVAVRRTKFVQTTQFLAFAKSEPIASQIEKVGLSPIDIWTEIRGVIKGGLDHNWLRVAPLSMHDFDGKVIKELASKRIITRMPQNPQEFVLSSDVQQGAILTEAASVAYRKIKKYFSEVDWSITEMGQKDYLKLSDENSMCPLEKRKLVYEIYLKYKSWLQDNDFLDENDLVRQVMKHGGVHAEFDCIIVDEIQDYTELQIYMLHQLSSNKKGIVFAGDSHQIINPTVFNERKLKRLIKDLHTVYLERNFRCQCEIVKMGNSLAQMRKKKIAAGKHETAELSSREGDAIVRLRYSESNLKGILQELLNYPNVAVLVPDDETKKHLIGVLGTDVYENAKNPIIFHISEIKGMEYKYVFSYNLVTQYKSEWNQILVGCSAKQTRFRYYFNLLYVAITRAQFFLSLMEVDDCSLLSELNATAPERYGYALVDTYSVSALGIDKLSNSNVDWEEQAERFCEAGRYEEALTLYEKISAPREKIVRCKAEIAIRHHEYDEAVRQFIMLDDTDSENAVKKYFDEITMRNAALRTLALMLIEPEKAEAQRDFDGKTLSSAIEDLYVGEERQVVYKKMIRNIDDRIGSFLKRK